MAGVTEVKVDLEGKSATITGTAGVAALMAAVEATGKEVQHASGGVHAGTEAAGALSAATDSAAPADGSKTPTRGRAGAPWRPA